MNITKEMIEAFAKSFYGIKGPQMVIEIGPEIEAALKSSFKVKPLKWKNLGKFGMHTNDQLVSHSLVGTYYVSGGDMWGCGLKERKFGSEDEAKSAAQYDFEQRIMSAIS